MGRTVAELTDTLSERELREWIAFYTIEPFGPERADMNAGIIAATIANCRPGRHAGDRVAEPKDFMPQYDKEPVVEATPEELKRRLIAAFGGKIKRKEAAP